MLLNVVPPPCSPWHLVGHTGGKDASESAYSNCRMLQGSLPLAIDAARQLTPRGRAAMQPDLTALPQSLTGHPERSAVSQLLVHAKSSRGSPQTEGRPGAGGRAVTLNRCETAPAAGGQPAKKAKRSQLRASRRRPLPLPLAPRRLSGSHHLQRGCRALQKLPAPCRYQRPSKGRG